MVRNWHTAMRS